MHKESKPELKEHKRVANIQLIKSMVGRVAVGGVVNSIVLAHNTKVLTRGAASLLGGDIHASIARRGESLVPRLRQRHESRQSSEVTSTRIRRFGNLALTYSVLAAEGITSYSSKRAAQLHEKSSRIERDFVTKKDGGRFVKAARAYRKIRSDAKSMRRQQKSNEKAVSYGLHEREYEESVRAASNSTLEELSYRRRYILQYFPESIYSFAKLIPREGDPGFNGNYKELAKKTLESALTFRDENDSIPLLGAELERRRLQSDLDRGMPIPEAIDHERTYIDGVSTLLWKLGYVLFKNERDVAMGRGEYNPILKIVRDADSDRLQIPFDPKNELHHMLAPDVTAIGGDDKVVEIVMPLREHEPYSMNIRVLGTPVNSIAAA